MRGICTWMGYILYFLGGCFVQVSVGLQSAELDGFVQMCDVQMSVGLQSAELDGLH